MIKNQWRMKLVFLLLVMLTACTPESISDAPAATPPTPPDSGKVSVVGRLIYSKGGAPVVNSIVRLAEVHREGEKGAFLLDVAFSPGTRSDDNGYFIFENVDPMEYVIIIGEAEGDYDIIENEDGSARTWKAEPDTVLDVGVLQVNLTSKDG